MLPYLALLLSTGLVVIDQLLKIWALHSLRPIGTYPIIEEILHLTYVENRGAAFGMMSGQQWLLIWVTAAVLLLIVLMMITGKVKDLFPLFTLSVILGGGVGNLIDRVYRGFVVDYIHLKVINFAVFNFADICVTCGTVVLMVWILFFMKDEKAETK